MNGLHIFAGIIAGMLASITLSLMQITNLFKRIADKMDGGK